MDYDKLTRSILPKVLEAMALINNPEIAPEVRQLNQEILLREVGTAIYNKIYDMNAFDFEIAHTTGDGIDDRYFGLAKVASGSISTGLLHSDYVKNYLYHSSSKAQHDAMTNARQSGKHPTMERSTNGKTCKWCTAKANTYENPTAEDFYRHAGCDCKIVTRGYRTRNGLLDNYVKPKDR